MFLVAVQMVGGCTLKQTARGPMAGGDETWHQGGGRMEDRDRNLKGGIAHEDTAGLLEVPPVPAWLSHALVSLGRQRE